MAGIGGGGTAEVYPFQDWRYRYIQGVGKHVTIEFVDPKKDGLYRMTRDPKEKYKQR